MKQFDSIDKVRSFHAEHLWNPMSVIIFQEKITVVGVFSNLFLPRKVKLEGEFIKATFTTLVC